MPNIFIFPSDTYQPPENYSMWTEPLTRVENSNTSYIYKSAWDHNTCYKQVLVHLYGLGLLLYTLGIVQNGVYHSGTPLFCYCTPLARLIWLREGSDQVPPVCDSLTVLTATEATPSFSG